MKRFLLYVMGGAMALCVLSSTGCMRRGADDSATPTPSATANTGRVSATSEVSPTAPKQTAGQSDDKLTPELVPLPEKLKGSRENPALAVYIVEEQSVQELPLEEYLQGVLAGEMKNDWPMEALKAQAILARTFVLNFLTEKESKYEGAMISTDIKEAQAYNAADVNDRIRQAIDATRGKVMVHDGKFPYAWFHAHSGGITALAREGLHWKDEEPPYLQSVKSTESDKAPSEDAKWTATFSSDEVLTAAKTAGLEVQSLKSIKLGDKGESGRTVTLLINGKPVNAPDLRIALDSMKMKSTLLESAALKGGKVIFSGKGYGHGVGMSQWGAYALAEQGATAEDIVAHYFRDVTIQGLW